MSRYVYVSLLVDGIFYLCFSEGYIAAVDVNTSEPRWIHQLQIPEFMAERISHTQPDSTSLVYRNGELLFTVDQGFGTLNNLTILDAATGQQVFQSEENITPEGCTNPIVINQYFIGGYGRYLSAFDIDKREFVWTYKHPKALDLFGSPLVPFEQGLAVGSSQDCSLYWFKSKS